MSRPETQMFRRVLFHARSEERLAPLLAGTAVDCRRIGQTEWTLAEDEVGLFLCDGGAAASLAAAPPIEIGEGADRLAVLFVGDGVSPLDGFWTARGEFALPPDAPPEHFARAIRSIFRTLEDRALSARARRAASRRSEEIRALVDVGIALSAERDLDRLLEIILSNARALTQADAGSLYLVESSDAGDVLKFVRAQNDSVGFEFVEATLPLDGSSIAAFVARTGAVVNVPDVSRLPTDAPYRFDGEFDRRYRYHSRSMLAVPLTTPDGKTIGVLQLLNRTRRVVPTDATITAFMRLKVVPFESENEEIVRALAAQAAVAVENRRLTESIRRLFEGFVQASVTAIEQRDPTTSGHSERVALLSCALAELASRIETGPFASFRIGREELVELRYAAVLHDFGKVGVREEVLVKARKLPPGRRDLIRSRIDQAILSAAAEIWEAAARDRWNEQRIAAELALRVSPLERAWRIVTEADEPSLLAEAARAELQDVTRLAYRSPSGAIRPVVEPEEIAFLSIPKGSLTAREREEIESHVTQTYRFLSKIPWTPDLSRVSEWAYAHHEKLDGSGYPRRLRAPAIPLPVRAITISDIYDALAARDRPYKKAVPSERALGILRQEAERALEILRQEAERGAIDADLLELFIDARIYEVPVGDLKT